MYLIACKYKFSRTVNKFKRHIYHNYLVKRRKTNMITKQLYLEKCYLSANVDTCTSLLRYITIRKYGTLMFAISFRSTVKPVFSGHSKRRPNMGFQDQLSLNAGQKHCRMLQWEYSAILSTFIKLPFVSKAQMKYMCGP